MAYFWSPKHHQTSQWKPKPLLILNIERNVSSTYIWERWKKQVREWFFQLLFQFRVVGGQSLSRQLRAQGRTPPWTRHPSMTGASHTHTHSDLDGSDTPVHLACISLGGERKRSSWRKPTQPWRGQAGSTPTVALAGNQFFFSSTLVILKQLWVKRRYLRTCYPWPRSCSREKKKKRMCNKQEVFQSDPKYLSSISYQNS